MKRFPRTVAGKTAVFLLTALLCAVTVASAVLGAVMIGAEVYTHTKEEFLLNCHQTEIREIAMNFTVGRCDGDCENKFVFDDRMQIELRDPKGTILAATEETFPLSAAPQYIFRFYFTQENGETVFLPTDAIAVDRPYYTANVYLSDTFEFDDPSDRMIDVLYAMKEWVWGIVAVGFLGSVLFFVLLMSVSGRRPDTEQLVPGGLHGIPTDLLFSVTAGVILLGWGLTIDLNPNEAVFPLLFLLLSVFTVGATLGLCMSAAVRIKDGSLLKNTLIWRILRWLGAAGKILWRFAVRVLRRIGSLFAGIPTVPKTALILFGFVVLDLLIFWGTCDEADNALIWRLIEYVLGIPALLWFAAGLKKLKDGGEALARGDTEFRIAEEGLFGDLKAHARNLNCISDGMTAAVNERLKSERMKTELITNVSHDLKTPLTSVINYAGLIRNEPCENPNILAYSEILMHQSEKLKRLIEDLVEASKASSGNLEIAPSPCDAALFVAQAAGEYEEKLRAAGLELITGCPEEPIRISADGRRMWRVFDNLMGNILKYAQPGTRVYLTLEREDRFALIVFRNTSREPLNLSPEELAERFVRGDRARTTEGNGLGLSIAQSLTALQNGTMDITVDGDLFKVTLRFPIL